MISSNFPNTEPSLNLDFANSKKLDPRITFTRASSATYYDGKTVAKAEENLLLWSQVFSDASWGKTNSTVTANSAAAPDGTTTATTWTKTTGTNTPTLSRQVTPTAGSVPITRSVFVKYIDQQWVRLSQFRSDSVLRHAWYDIQNGVVGTVSTGVTASIQDAGNGWYRLIFVLDSVLSSNQSALMAMADANASTSDFAGTQSVYVWGAQYEMRSSVTAYTPTTTAPITNYVPVLLSAPANVARFDHNPTTGESLGLLIEEQRANLLTYSEQFDNAAWVKDQATITVNANVAPDGTQTADVLVENTTTSIHRATYSANFTTGVTYTTSVYAKANGRNFLHINAAVAHTARATFDLSTGTVAGIALGTASILSVGNGWYRCSVVGTASSTATRQMFFQLNNTAVATDTTYTGDGYSGIYIWGAQLEAGAFPTSYIKTEASQVTRSADSATMTGTNFSSWYRQDEGSLFGDAFCSAGSSNIEVLAALVDAATNNYVYVGGRNQSSVYRALTVRTNNVQQAGIDPGSVSFGSVKVLGTFANNSFAGVFNGGGVGLDLSGTMPVVNELRIGRLLNTMNVWNGHIKRITYWPKRLPDSQLQYLTAN